MGQNRQERRIGPDQVEDNIAPFDLNCFEYGLGGFDQIVLADLGKIIHFCKIHGILFDGSDAEERFD